MLVFATIKFLISARQLYIWYGDKWRNLRRFTYSAVASPLYVVGKFLISTEEKLICYPRKEERYQRDAYSFISRVLSKQNQLTELERDRVRENRKNTGTKYSVNRKFIVCEQETNSERASQSIRSTVMWDGSCCVYRQATSLWPSTLKARKLHITTDLLTGLLGCVRRVTGSQPEGFSI